MEEQISPGPIPQGAGWPVYHVTGDRRRDFKPAGAEWPIPLNARTELTNPNATFTVTGVTRDEAGTIVGLEVTRWEAEIAVEARDYAEWTGPHSYGGIVEPKDRADTN